MIRLSGSVKLSWAVGLGSPMGRLSASGFVVSRFPSRFLVRSHPVSLLPGSWPIAFCGSTTHRAVRLRAGPCRIAGLLPHRSPSRINCFFIRPFVCSHSPATPRFPSSPCHHHHLHKQVPNSSRCSLRKSEIVRCAGKFSAPNIRNATSSVNFAATRQTPVATRRSADTLDCPVRPFHTAAAPKSPCPEVRQVIFGQPISQRRRQQGSVLGYRFEGHVLSDLYPPNPSAAQTPSPHFSPLRMSAVFG